MPATGTARRDFSFSRETLPVPGGGTVTIGMTKDGEIKLTGDTDCMIESFCASGPTARREGFALILAPIER